MMQFLPLAAALIDKPAVLRMFDVPDDVLLRYDHVIVHVTATPPPLDIAAPWIDDLHRRSNGWRHGNGYHVVLPFDGDVQSDKLGDPCRPLTLHGAHVGDCGPGWNTRSLGIVLVGGVDENLDPEFNATNAQLESLKFVLRLFWRKHPKPWTLKLMGHRDLIRQTGAPPKACPCFDVATWAERAGVFDGFDFQGDMEDAARAGQGTMAIPKTYTIKRGDNLWAIAQRFGLTVPHLRDLNNIRGSQIRPGQELRLTKR